jgi:flagellar protein FliL
MAAAIGGGGAKAAPAPSLKKTIGEIAIVTIVAAAIGLGFAATQPAPPALSTQAGAADKQDKPARAPERPAAANLLELPPIITNLAAPSDTWIRLEVSIVFDPREVPHPEVVGGEIAGDLLAYLRTVSVAQLEGPIGLQNLRQDLTERVSIRSAGKVSELVIRTLVVQ